VVVCKADVPNTYYQPGLERKIGEVDASIGRI
jgi:hypothetical protein